VGPCRHRRAVSVCVHACVRACVSCARCTKGGGKGDVQTSRQVEAGRVACFEVLGRRVVLSLDKSRDPDLSEGRRRLAGLGSKFREDM
jgi:hypothetical protein